MRVLSPADKKKNEEIASAIVKDYQQLSGCRGNWESHWQEIAERVWPSHSRLFQQQAYSQTQGEKRNEQLFDSTPAIALGRFAAILDSLLTPRNQTWHRLVASDPALNKDRDVRLWFEDLNRTLFKYRYAPMSNFSSQIQINYKMLGAFGTGCLFIDQLKTIKKKYDGLRYKSVHLSQIYFRENHQGIVDCAYRYFSVTARNAVTMFNPDELPASIVECAKKAPDREFYFIHAVKPREDYDDKRVDAKGMPYGEYYVSIEGKALVEEGGYNTFPYAISRYEQVPGEVYGRSPAMDVLPAIKTLNEEKKTILKQGHRVVDPVLLAYDDGVIDTFSLRPGAINAGGVNAQGQSLVQPLPVGNIAIGKDLMDDERAVINDAFLVTLFQILVETPQMTATEVLERTREKGILIAPTVGRQQSEKLGPMIEREIDILVKQGKILPMPQALLEARGEYRIEYESPLSRSARAEEAAGALRTIELALNAAAQAQNPALLDHFNWDTIIPEIGDINGMPASWRNGAQMISQMREARAEAASDQQAVAAAPGAAAIIKSTAAARKMDRE